MDKYKAEFIAKAMELIEQELNNPTTDASSVLFGIELGASDWQPEDAVECLFRYASKYGWSD